MKVKRNRFRILRSTLLLAGACVWVGTAWGLGLGSLEIQSNLDQPLDGVIELRLGQGDDLNSVKARLATRDEFNELGIDYPDYIGTVRLIVEERGGEPVLRILSDSAINEPFVHFLIRVDWTGGSFLREYTALIDPPIYAAESPPAISQPRVVDTPTLYTNEDAAELDVPDTVPSEAFTEQISNYETEGSEERQPLAEDSTVSADKSAATENSESEYLNSELGTDLDAQYGPVVAGESLSEIAAELQEQFPDLSIYQIMKVMFEENQSAFIKGNINGLLQGSILKIGDINAIRAVEMADARAFYAEQLADWSPSYLIADADSQDGDNAVRVGQDDYAFGEELASDSYRAGEFGEGASATGADSDITETFRVGATTEADAFVSNSQSDSREGEVIALRSQITQLEASLASSSMENQELTERISMLEGQLADLNRLLALGVDDAEMANLEATLANQNDAAEDQGLEIIDLDADSTQNNGAATSQADDSATQDMQNITGETESVNDAAGEIASSGAQESKIEEVKETAPQPLKVKTSSGFFGDFIDSISESGMGTMLGSVGAILLGGLALLIYRRRRADEEFEVSMLSIETASVNEANANNGRVGGADNSITEDANSKHSKETSFLTVYSDTDAVVQADEVDPLAEADVYIAYGRNEQAEEVLLDGIASNPDRIDIKQKLLALYHKSKNQQGFERIAEELYGQRELVSDRDWANVIAMGQEISPENPLFDDATAVAGSALTQGNKPVAKAQEADDDKVAELVNFDDVRSQLSELDEVELNVLDEDDAPKSKGKSKSTVEAKPKPAKKAQDDEDELGLLYELDDELTLTADGISYDIDDEGQVADSAKPVKNAKPNLEEDSNLDFDGGSENTEGGVSDLEVASSYDEARTQYELAKVFVDLGDEDGAKKILRELAKAEDIDDEVHADALALLDAIDN